MKVSSSPSLPYFQGSRVTHTRASKHDAPPSLPFGTVSNPGERGETREREITSPPCRWYPWNRQQRPAEKRRKRCKQDLSKQQGLAAAERRGARSNEASSWRKWVSVLKSGGQSEEGMTIKRADGGRRETVVSLPGQTQTCTKIFTSLPCLRRLTT